MKIKTRIISIMMIMLMLISGMSFGSYAASTGKGTVYVTVTQDYANAQKVLKLVNKQRAKRHLRKLKLDKSLTNSAVQRAAEITMVIPNTSPHRRPDGRAAKTVNKRATRENCAEGTFGSASAVVSTWMHSKPHKATLLLKSAKSVGIAYVTNPGDPYCGYYVLIVSNKKAKKIEKSKSKVSSTKAVVALSKYLNKKYFFPEDAGNRTTLNVGQKTQIKTYYSGPQSMDFTAPEVNPGSFTWTSSNNSVATVNASGTVTAVSPGTVTINAKLKNGPSITVSRSYTVRESSLEDAFNKLTKFVMDKYYAEDELSGYGDGWGYEGDGAYYFKYYGGHSYDESYRNYVIVPEHEDDELAFLYKYDYYDEETGETTAEYRTYMIVTKGQNGKVGDTIYFQHDYLDGNGQCIYELHATADRNNLIIENLDWQDWDGEASLSEDDYGLILSQTEKLFSYTQHLYNYSGVRQKDLGIERIYID